MKKREARDESLSKKLASLPVVITGASSGIGMAFARELSRRGLPLVISARRADRLRALADELAAGGNRVSVVAADLSNDRGIDALVRAVMRGGGAGGLVHAAGFGTWGHFASVDPSAIDDQVRCHCAAASRLARAVLPGMIERGEGFLVMVSSMASLFTTSNFTNYSATKAFLNMLCAGLADELRETGVKVQSLCPGLTKTEFLEAESFSGLQLERVPPSVWMTPDQVVKESLAALDRGTVIFIPGWKNRLFAGVMKAPVLGSLTALLVGGLGRKSGLF